MRPLLAFPFAALALVFLFAYGVLRAVADTVAGEDDDDRDGGCPA